MITNSYTTMKMRHLLYGWVNVFDGIKNVYPPILSSWPAMMCLSELEIDGQEAVGEYVE